MNKDLFWKVLNFIENEGDIDFMRWFEAAAFLYAKDQSLFDDVIKVLCFYDKE